MEWNWWKWWEAETIWRNSKAPVSLRSCFKIFKSSCLKVDPTLPILVPWICLESHPHLSIFGDLCVSVQDKTVSEIEDAIEQDNTGCVRWPYEWKPKVIPLARLYMITQSAKLWAQQIHSKTVQSYKRCIKFNPWSKDERSPLPTQAKLRAKWKSMGKGWKGDETTLESRLITAFATMRIATTGSTRRSGCLRRGPS